MTKHRQILNFIFLIRESHPSMIDIYTKGSCFNFHLILRKIYPESECYYDSNHIITKIGKYYYDITGVVKRKNHLLFSTYYNKKTTSKGFNQMVNKAYFK